MTPRAHGKLWGFIGFTSVAALMAYYAFVSARSLNYPWWHMLTNDGDGIYVTQTLALLNGGDLMHIYHPGATLLAIHGAVYRVLAWFFPPYHQFLQLAHMPNLSATFGLLDLAMHTSRVITYALNLLALAMFWKLLTQLTKSGVLAFFLAAFFMTTPFMMYLRITTIRPELLNFMFCALMLSMVLNLRERQNGHIQHGIFWSIMLGVVAGLGLLAKIQIGPELVGVALFWIFSKTSFFDGLAAKKTAAWGLAVALANGMIMPWAWFKRPAFVSDAYIKHFYPGSDQVLIYWSVPATLQPQALCALGGLLLLSLAGWFLHRRFPACAEGVLKLNLLVTGVILACYAVLVPLGMDFPHYWAASNHLLYAVVTSILSGSSLNHFGIDALTWQRIINLHNNNPLLGVNILWFVLIAAAASFIRIALRTPDQRPFCAALLFFAAGFVMDTLSSFRRYTPDGPIISTFAIYSLSAHCCGFGIWLAQESRYFLKRWPMDLKLIVCLGLALHLVFLTDNIVKNSAASDDAQTPQQEMLNTMSQVGTFWYIASQGKISKY